MSVKCERRNRNLLLGLLGCALLIAGDRLPDMKGTGNVSIDTEEQWLLAQYGAKYQSYCKRTNRCIPWFPQKGIKK